MSMPTMPRSRHAIAFSTRISLSSNGNARSRQKISPGFTGYSRLARSMPRLPAAVALHRVEAQLHRRDVVLAVRAAHDLVHGALDRERRALDQLRPMEQLEVAVERLGALRRDGDEVPELPVVLGRELDALCVGNPPHDRRGYGRTEVAVELGEWDGAGKLTGHLASRIAEASLRLTELYA